MNATEPTTIGLSDRVHGYLTQMKEDNHIAEMLDGYRLGVAFALSQGMVDPPEVKSPKKTVFSIASVDPDHEIALAISALIDLDGQSVYRMAERLAEWGLNAIHERFDGGHLDVAALIKQTQGAA